MQDETTATNLDAKSTPITGFWAKDRQILVVSLSPNTSCWCSGCSGGHSWEYLGLCICVYEREGGDNGKGPGLASRLPISDDLFSSRKPRDGGLMEDYPRAHTPPTKKR